MKSVGLILSQKKKEGQDLSKSPGKYEKENMIYTIKKVIAFVWLLIYLKSVMKLWGRFDGFVKISVSRSQILAPTLYIMHSEFHPHFAHTELLMWTGRGQGLRVDFADKKWAPCILYRMPNFIAA